MAISRSGQGTVGHRNCSDTCHHSTSPECGGSAKLGNNQNIQSAKMCQVAVYLDEEKIMEDVMLVESTFDGVRLIKLFEPPRLIPATIRQIDLMKNKLILEPIEKGEVKQNREVIEQAYKIGSELLQDSASL